MNKTDFRATALLALAFATFPMTTTAGSSSGPAFVGMTPEGQLVRFEEIGKYERRKDGRYVLKDQAKASPAQKPASSEK